MVTFGHVVSYMRLSPLLISTMFPKSKLTFVVVRYKISDFYILGRFTTTENRSFRPQPFRFFLNLRWPYIQYYLFTPSGNVLSNILL